jgi:hypothetical protein
VSEYDVVQAGMNGLTDGLRSDTIAQMAKVSADPPLK